MCPETGSGIADDAGASFSEHYSLPQATPSLIVICHGFGCQERTPVGLSSADIAQLNRLMAPGRASASAERRAVATAVAWLDRRVGPEAGTAGRSARAIGVGDPRQMDCIDTTHNNHSLFQILDALHLLHHHTVRPPAGRGLLLNGQTPHATAVLRETRDQRDWAFDNWTHKYGDLPDVLPLDTWLDES